MITIEVFTVAECPNAQPTLSLLEAIVAQQRLRVQVRHVVVPDEKTAIDLRFPGSPTVRVNGHDVDPLHAATGYGLACRIYYDGERPSGVPPASLFHSALEAAGA